MEVVSAELFKALLKAQSEFVPAKKEAKNKFKGYNYADINSVLEVVRPILNKHGLVVTQAVHSSPHPEFHPIVVTSLIHAESGQSVISPMTIPCDARDVQKLGAAITYARRYALVSLLSLEQEDPDGDQQVAGELARTSVPTAAKTCHIYRKMELEDKQRLATMLRDAGMPGPEMKTFADKVAGWTWDAIKQELLDRLEKK